MSPEKIINGKLEIKIELIRNGYIIQEITPDTDTKEFYETRKEVYDRIRTVLNAVEPGRITGV